MIEGLFKLGFVLIGLAAAQSAVAALSGLSRWNRARRLDALRAGRLAAEISALRQRAERAAAVATAWNGWRMFRLAQRVDEGGGICSFYLAPHDDKPLPTYRPGQYLTFQFKIAGQDKPVVRCYSLSDAPKAERYRVSVKRVTAPQPGLVSNFLHDSLREGSLIEARAPAGHFFLELEDNRPIVLLAGGVGITPLLAMLNTLIERGDGRETWLFYGARQPDEVIQRERFESLAREHDWLRLYLCFSDHEPGPPRGALREIKSRVSLDLLRRELPASNYDFYLCGPPPMMQSLTDGLREWGVPDEQVHFEAFGPASVKRAAPVAAPSTTPEAQIEVTFQRSGKRCLWTPSAGTLLDLAEANGVSLESGCRAGNCGSCSLAVRSGDVEYATPPGFAVDTGSCLACIARPKGPVVLEA